MGIETAASSLLNSAKNTILGGAQPAAEGKSLITLAQANVGIPADAAGIKSSLWDIATVEESRWNQSYPYQLILVEKRGKGYVRATDGVFTLPIPPQSLSVSTPFAITTNVTQGGIIEEHNGSPIRTISISGTTGVLPARTSTDPLKQSNNLAQAIFAGTINAAKKVATNFNAILDGNKARFTSNLVKPDDLARGGSLEHTTGYYQFQILGQFLESYVNLKKTAKGKNFRLALAIWKDNQVLLVTPENFNLQRNANNPLEYNYNMAFKAYGRINLTNPPSASQSPLLFNPREPNALASVLNRIEDARRTLSAAKNVIGAVRADVDNALFRPLREVALFVKDALGVAITLADLPNNIVADCKGALLEYHSIPANVDQASQALGSLLDNFAGGTTQATTIAQFSGVTSKGSTGSGLLPGVQKTLDSDPHPANKIISNPSAFYNFFSTVKVGALNVPPTVNASIVNERARVRTFTRLDFEQMRDTMQVLAQDFEDAVGAQSNKFSDTLGRARSTSTKVPTSDDFQVIFALNQAIMEMNRLASVSVADKSATDPVQYVAALAGQAGIDFKLPNSKFAIPFPYGSTLEMLATRYLGSPDRWIEIATMNHLKAPYIDEEGFYLPFLVNGNGHDVLISSGDNLFSGQFVSLASLTVAREKRRIVSVKKISDNQFLIKLDGLDDLAKFKVSDSAQLHTYLPDTVNSQQLIYIPSTLAPGDTALDPNGKGIPGLDQYAQLLQVGGVDLLLTGDGDLALTPQGDAKLAIGLQNLVQQVKLAVATPIGALLHHPTYGFPVQIGTSTADLDANYLLSATKNLLAGDSTFVGINSIAILKSGPSIQIGMAVEAAGVSQLIPITIAIS